jgi:hypothetical protein
MIQPATGTMTIIDFDWFKPYAEFKEAYPFEFYNNPPECLLYIYWSRVFHINPDRSYTFQYDPLDNDAVEVFVNIDKVNEYAQHQYASFSNYYKELGLLEVDETNDNNNVLNTSNEGNMVTVDLVTEETLEDVENELDVTFNSYCPDLVEAVR